MYRQALIYIFSMLLLGVLSLPVFAADDLNRISFPEDQWSAELLDTIAVGPYFLSTDEQFDIESPPQNSDQKTKDELVYLKTLAETARTDDVVARIRYENGNIQTHELFAQEGLFADGNEKTVALFNTIDRDHRYFILERKKHFARARPSQLDPALKTVILNPAHAAYPSGHASQAYMTALVLSAFDPNNMDKYKKVAIDIAHRREIAGIHYPSDSDAGRKLAVYVLERLRNVSAFEKQFQDAQISYIKPQISDDKHAG